jgi:Protein of unknwon function (DUF3008)
MHAKSAAQQRAAGAALSAKRGETPMDFQGASRRPATERSSARGVLRASRQRETRALSSPRPEVSS